MHQALLEADRLFPKRRSEEAEEPNDIEEVSFLDPVEVSVDRESDEVVTHITGENFLETGQIIAAAEALADSLGIVQQEVPPDLPPPAPEPEPDPHPSTPEPQLELHPPPQNQSHQHCLCWQFRSQFLLCQ